MAQRDQILKNAHKTQFVHFDGPAAVVYLTEGYPNLLPTQAAFAGCAMPNPDIGPLIQQWRPKHVADHGPQTILDLRNAMWAQRNPSPKGGDVLLLAAGPSLAEHLIDIRRYHEHATVVALNRAVIAYPNPDVFFCLERQSRAEWWTQGYWAPVDPRTAVVTAPSCHAAILDHFPAGSRWYCATPWCGYDRWEDADQWALSLPAIPTCETTMSAAMAFCAMLEPKRIIMVGADHAWKVAADEPGNMAEVRDYYCDGEKWPGGPLNIAGVEGINARLCAISYFSQKHAEVTIACARQIEKTCDIEVINASAHGIVRHNVQNDFFFREIQGRKEKAEKEKAERLNKRFETHASNGSAIAEARTGASAESAATHGADHVVIGDNHDGFISAHSADRRIPVESDGTVVGHPAPGCGTRLD